VDLLRPWLAEADPPELRAKVAAVRTHLSAGAALGRAGRAEPAVAAMEAASIEAEATHYPPVIAEAKLAYGRTGVRSTLAPSTATRCSAT
jgi:hypothetical protein